MKKLLCHIFICLSSISILSAQTDNQLIPGVKKIKDVTIYKDSMFYSAFPSVIRLSNGEILVAFRRAPNRKVFKESKNNHLDPNSYLVTVRSKDGVHWSKRPELLYAHPFGGSQDPCLLKLKDGTIDLTHFSDILRMMLLQEQLERLCWLQGNRKQTAPAQRMADFCNRRLSYDLPESSYAPGLVSSPLHFWMPSFIGQRLEQGFRQFGKNARGFLTNEAVMIGMETRTSSPVRILRRPDTLQHVRLRGLFPCGEGAGYAGGIVSAGIDGERCAEAVVQYCEATRQTTY